jgi:radical SAM protein with 4Fe4S-binding SPASM domain
MEQFFPLHTLVFQIKKGCPVKEIYFRAIDDFFELFGMFMNFGGDPLSYPDFFEIMNYANEKGVKGIGVRTQYLDERHAKNLKKHNARAIMLPLQSLEREKNDKYGIGRFEKTMDGIALCNKYGLGLEITTIITKDNIDELKDMIKFCIENHVHILVVQRSVMLKALGINEEPIEGKEYKKLLRFLVYKNRELRKKKLMGISISNCPHKILFGEHLKQAGDVGGCSGGLISCVINEKCDVTPCLPLLDVPAGNLKERSLKEIWEGSELFRKLRDRSNIKGKCSKCEYLKLCAGCRADAYFKYGDLFAEDPTCWL